MKRSLICLLVLVLLLGTASTAVAEEPQTIRDLSWRSQARHDLTVAAIDVFMEKNPNIRVEIEFTDWGGYWSKLATQAAGGMVPDVVQMDYAYITQYASNDVLADLTPYVESGALNIENISESMLESGRVGEGLYAIPCGSTAPVLMYRPDVLEQANVTMPIAPTESEFAKIMKTVYETTGRTTNSDYGWEGVRYHVRNYGLNLYNDEGTALGFDDPAYIVYVWQRYLNEVEAGYCLAVGETTASTPFDAYISDVWSAHHSSNELSAYQSGSNCELQLAVLPAMDDATQVATYVKPTMFWAISNNSTVKDAAIAFINYYTHDTDCYDIMGLDRGIPVSSAVREYLTPNLSDTDKKVVAIMDYLAIEGNSSPVMNPDIPVHSELNSLYDNYFEQVQYGMVEDLTAHAQAFMDEANAIIANSLTAE